MNRLVMMFCAALVLVLLPVDSPAWQAPAMSGSTSSIPLPSAGSHGGSYSSGGGGGGGYSGTRSMRATGSNLGYSNRSINQAGNWARRPQNNANRGYYGPQNNYYNNNSYGYGYYNPYPYTRDINQFYHIQYNQPGKVGWPETPTYYNMGRQTPQGWKPF